MDNPQREDAVDEGHDGRVATRFRNEADPQRCRLTVVIPTRNEAANIPTLQNELALALAGIDHEIIVVDDSTDTETRPVLAAAAQRDPNWRVIERPPAEQTGLSTAVIRGIQAAHGEAVCVMDGDLQHPPDVIPRLLAAVETGADVAVASRYMQGGSRAGLGGLSRQFVSRAATWGARLLFPEARQTTDPLTGFFCCRREALAGLEYRPLGFKILLEVLVCSHGLRVAEVPLTFRARPAGESKATARQGILYFRHLWSLFLYVPGSARTAKFIVVSASALVVFFPFLWLLHHSGMPWLLAWIVASGVSTSISVGLHHLFTFRDLARHGEPDGARIYYPLVAISALASFATFAVTFTGRTHPWLVLAAVSQCVGLIVTIVLNQPRLRQRIRSTMPFAGPATLEALGKRLGAHRSWWVDIEHPFAGPERRRLVRLVGTEVIENVARRRRPMLWVETPSPRPQPRVNVEITSALLIPHLQAEAQSVAVAVFARHAQEVFEIRHLQEAINWLDQFGGRWRPVASGERRREDQASADLSEAEIALATRG